MNALHTWLTLRGQGFSERLNAWVRVFRFAVTALIGVLSPSTYNKATRLVVQKQIYFTAWEILPGFAAFAALFSFLIIEIVGTTARKYGLYEYALELIVRILVIEILPLMTALFIALRTGAAINTEVALMKIQNELDALQRIGIDPMRLELLPRVVGGTISVLALTAVNIVVALWLTNLLIVDFHPWTLTTSDFTRMIGKVLDMPALLVLWAKTLAFGFAVTVIPISEGLNTPQKLFYAPIAVLRGMVRLFFALMLIEAAALAIVYV
ncbi:MAG: ABC transporter permease [Betaproteobacteria bacterium]|nr:ABC transporter permease [Betaproteobacteria bacterium]